MSRVILSFDEDHNGSYFGLIPVTFPSTTRLAYCGTEVAHQILEQFPKNNDTVEDDLMALGAKYWLRGEGGYYNGKSYWPLECVLAGDMMEIFRLSTGLIKPDEIKVCEPFGFYDGNIANMFYEVIPEGFYVIAEEMKHYEYNETEIETYKNFAGNLDVCDNILHWILKGYHNAAHKRYNKYKNCDVLYIFEEIERITESLLKEWSRYPYHNDGRRVLINYDILNKSVMVKVETEDNYTYHRSSYKGTKRRYKLYNPQAAN